MSQAARDTSANAFDLGSLLYHLMQRASVRLKRKGCYKPEDCSPKLVWNYLMERSLGKPGRVVIEGNTISINFPGARDPLLVLYKFLFLEVRAFRRRCEDCNCMDQLPELAGDERPAPVHSSLITAVGPDSMLEATELFELVETAFPNEAHHAAFNAIVIEERPYEAVADDFKMNVGTLRQWICRDKKRIRKVLLENWQSKSVRSLKTVRPTVTQIEGARCLGVNQNPLRKGSGLLTTPLLQPGMPGRKETQ